MPYHDQIVRLLGIITVASPTLLVVVLGLAALADRPLSERAVGRWGQGVTVVGLLASLCLLIVMLAFGTRIEPVDFGTWISVPHYEFTVKFVFDRLSVPLVILSFMLCGTIGAFANRYMHREQGFRRFFAMYSIFLLGMTITSLAGTVETLFTGWELVGLSSALLVAFYHERPAPCRNGLRVWIVYRISDAALLIASILLHHLRGHGEFSEFLGGDPWPYGHSLLTAGHVLPLGLLLIVAAAGKSALVPFSGWLPRAMEGPTPSSAVFYGALSVHLGAFLLLRFSPMMEIVPLLGVVIIALGGVTALFAAFACRVQTDIKCALSFASLTQVGLIVVEIGVGLYVPFFRYVALFHILGHACLRTLQFVRAPTLLYDYRLLENALGEHLSHAEGRLTERFSERMKLRLYRLALERGYLDKCLNDYAVKPFVAVLLACDRAERAWTAWLGGAGKSSEPHRPAVPSVTLTDD